MPSSEPVLPVLPARGRLDRETVVATAEELVDAQGYDALTMTLLAGRLDTRVSSLYNHVANLEELRSEIQVRAMRLLGASVQHAAMGHAGADGLRVLCRELRRFAHTHPQRYVAITRTPIQPPAFFEAAGAVIEALAVMVRSTGLEEHLILPTGMAIFSALHGFVSLEVAGYFGDLDSLESVFDQVVRGAVTTAVLAVTDPTAPAQA